MMLKKTALLVCTLVCVFFLNSQSFGQSTTFKSGTAIIDMGSATPTVKNSLKPYGLIYALLKNNHVPVNYVVNTGKVKDGIDFIYNGKSYKGGTFVISADYISSDVTTVLNSWANQGVVIDYTTSDLSVTVTQNIKFVPKWVMDKNNGNIAVAFLTAAGIPSSAYVFKDPSLLADCDDIFVLPHADPTWATHNNLYDWNRTKKGAIWAGCHAVSVLENLKDNDLAPTKQMNFLTTGGMIPFTSHNATSTPFANLLPGDPVAQYIGKTDNAQLLGSETVYLPSAAWNASAKILTSSPAQQDVPSLSAGVAAENIYGRGFGLASSGYVAYQASHNIGGTSADNIAAQRIFFNFSLFALSDKVPPIITANLTGQPELLSAGTASGILNATATGSGTGFTYKWSASVPGTFSAPTSATTTFTPDNSIVTSTPCILTVVVTESCGRVSFEAKKITIIPPPSGHTLTNINITKNIDAGCATASVTFNVFDGNPDADAGTRTLLSVTGLAGGTVITKTNGDITYTVNPDQPVGTTGTFIVTNGISNSPSGNITITVGGAAAPTPVADAVTAITDNLTTFNVLANDGIGTGAAGLYIKDIVTKPTKGYAYISTNGQLTYLSNQDQGVVGSDVIGYLACNNLGYCAVGQVNITLLSDLCSTGQYAITTTGTITSSEFIPSTDATLQYLPTSGGVNTTTLRNSGAVATLQINSNVNTTRRSVLKFDVSGIPVTATVNSASLTVMTAAGTTGTAPTGASSAFPATLYPVTKAWTEGIGTGLATDQSDVTWINYKGIVGTTATAWTTAGGDYTIGTSDPTITLANGTIATVNSTVLQSTDMKVMVGNWVATPGSNNGLIIVPTILGSFNYQFYSREGTNPPRLAVNYTAQPCLAIPTNYLPIVYPDATVTASNFSVTISPLTNDRNYYSNVNKISAVGGVAGGPYTTAHGGTVTIINTNTQLVYLPSGNYTGVDTLTYTVQDQTNLTTNTATVYVTVTRVGPIIQNDITSTPSNTAQTIVVGANDSDPQGGGLSAPTIVSNASNGTITVVGNDILYTPSSNFVGTDVFTYRRSALVADPCASALANTATVTVTVTNQNPVANPASISTFACVDGALKVINIASDPESGALSATIVSGPSHGSVVATADGRLVYTPTVAYAGADAFTYRVTDPLSATSSAATVSITVSGTPEANIAPVAVNDADTTLRDQLLYTNVIQNDSDPNNDALSLNITATGLTAPAHGTITVMPNKLIRYTPAAGYVGSDSYQYQLTDSHPGCSVNPALTSIATVNIIIKAIPTNLSGTVWNDVDASGTATFTNIMTNTETGTNGNGSVYVYVIDNNNKIIDKTPADVDGTYLLSSVPSLTSNLKLVLSAEDIAVGGSIVTGSVPTGYNNSTPMVRALPTTTLADMGPYDWGIYINPALLPGSIVGPSTVCGTTTAPGALTATANAGGGSVTATGYFYQWQSSTTSASTGFTDIGGATSTNYTPAAGIATTTYYRRSVTNNLNTPVFSNVVTVTVTTLPTVGISPATANILAGGNIALTASGADSYVWSPATGLSATNTAGVTASPATTTMYTVTGTLTPSGCVGTASITVTVVNAGTIGTDQARCGSYTPTALTSVADASGGTGITYQWQSSTTSVSTGFSNIATATATTYAPSAITVTTYYRRVATIGGTPYNSNAITATVNANPVIGISPTSATIALGTTQIFTASGANTYVWTPAATLSANNTAAVTATPTAVGGVTYTVTGTITASGCTGSGTVLLTTVPSGSLIPGTIGSPQTICSLATAGAFTSTAASGGTGTINYQWQQSTDNVTFTNIPTATSATYGAGALSQTTYYRRGASTSTDAVVYTGSVKVTVLAKPVIIGGISGVCAMPRDSIKTFSVTPAANATNYVWTVPATGGWSGTSTTNTINVKAGTTNGTISVTPYNLGCAGAPVTYNIAIIDYASVTITGTPVSASGNNNNPVTVKIQLIDVLGNLIGCSGGPASLCTSSGTFTSVVDNGDGTYTSYLISSANNVTICGSVAGVAISKTTNVTFTGPQGGIKSNGPIFDFEIPKITFTATDGRAPFTVIYHSAQAAVGKNDTLRNVTSGVAYPVALIPATTLYKLVSVIDANGERRDNNFTRDTTTTRVVIPKVIITLKADPAVKGPDSTWATRIVVHTKNIGDLDLTNSQARLNLKDVFPSPVTYVLDSVRVSGSTVTPNRNYDGVTSTDLFARINKKKHDLYTNTSELAAAPDGSSMELWSNVGNDQSEDNSELQVIDDGHSVYMFGPLSNLPVGMDATIILWLHVKPNGYTEPFVMQAVALGTGNTEGATSLTTSLSNDNDNVNEHPEVTKKGDPLPAVINLFPTASIGASLNAGLPEIQGNGTYNVLLTYKLKNYGNVNLRNVTLTQNLLTSIGAPSTFNVVGLVSATGGLIINPSFNAKTDINMLSIDNILGYKQESVLTFTINITPNQLSSIYRLQATTTGFSDDLNTTVTDLSTDGTNPDPDGNNIPSEKIITTILINLAPPPLVPGTIGIKTGPTTTVPAKGYCASANNVEVIPVTVSSGGLDAYQYQWQSSVDNITFKDIIGAESATYTTGLVSSSIYLRRGTISGSQLKYTNSVYIQIYSVPATPIITGSGTVVVGKGNVTLTAPVATAYTWSTGETTRSIIATDAGNYTVTVADANGCTAVALAYAINALEVGKVADIQKVLTKAPALQQDGSFLLTFNIIASNLRPELLDTVRIKDDLSKVFPTTATFSVVDIRASGALIANGSYDGKVQIDMLNDVSKLAGAKKDSIQLTIKVFPNGFSGTLNNVATLTARSPLGTVSVSSNDPLSNNDPSVRLPTKFVLPPVDIFIPSGFSPNHDGFNDNFVITRPFNTTIRMEIYNRWSNLVYRSLDYKNDWNGKGNQANRILGEDLPDGTYYYEVIATNSVTGAVRKFAGSITLKR